MASSFTRFLDHTQRRTTLGRTPLDEWSARRRDLYLTTHTTLTTDKFPCFRWDSNPNPSRRATADLRLRPRGHWDRQNSWILPVNTCGVNTQGAVPGSVKFAFFTTTSTKRLLIERQISRSLKLPLTPTTVKQIIETVITCNDVHQDSLIRKFCLDSMKQSSSWEPTKLSPSQVIPLVLENSRRLYRVNKGTIYVNSSTINHSL